MNARRRKNREAIRSRQPAACQYSCRGGKWVDAFRCILGTDARDAIRDMMLYGEIVTEIGTEEDWEHLLLVETIPYELLLMRWFTGEWTYEEVGDYRITTNIPLSEVSTDAANAILAFDISSESESVITALATTGGLWRSQCTDVPQWKSLITGETSTAAQFRAILEGYLRLRTDTEATTAMLQASFGSFGELPVIVVRLPDCYYLMDPCSGNSSGPFEPASPFDATGLLSQYQNAYQAESSVRYYNWLGCTATDQDGLIEYRHPCPSPCTGTISCPNTQVGDCTHPPTTPPSSVCACVNP